MSERPTNIPESVLACVWYADPEKIDWDSQKKGVVITSILNRGTWEAVRWVYRFYGEQALRTVVSHPDRGRWFPQALQFWLRFFNLTLKSDQFRKALFSLAPLTTPP